MRALGLLDVEAHVLDPALDVEIEKPVRVVEVVLADDRDHVEGHALALQEADARHRLVERAAPGAGDAPRVVQSFRAVDADADADLMPLEEIAPLGRDQRSVRLERMLDGDRLGTQRLDGLERPAIEGGRHDQRFAGVPDDGDLGRGVGRGEDLAEARLDVSSAITDFELRSGR